MPGLPVHISWGDNIYDHISNIVISQALHKAAKSVSVASMSWSDQDAYRPSCKDVVRAMNSIEYVKGKKKTIRKKHLRI